MIHIDRNQIAPPEILADDKAGGTEREEAKKIFDAAIMVGSGVKGSDFDFSIYGHAQVREALEKLFKGKCAYCEGPYAAVQPMEVEHWRPKNAVVENGKLSYPGYWWLASDWENLLPSCIDCNRQRRHAIEGEVQKAGKACLFPLADGTPRALPFGEKAESPLLLNPCVDVPENHLEFRPDGTVNHRSDKGEASIKTYGLHRPGLVQERARAARELLIQMDVAAACLRAAEADPADAFKAQMAQMTFNALKATAASGGLYSAFKAAFIEQFIKDPYGFLAEQRARTPDLPSL